MEDIEEYPSIEEVLEATNGLVKKKRSEYVRVWKETRNHKYIRVWEEKKPNT